MRRTIFQGLNGNGITRVQSASSINTYRQCPRKYFYQYIMKLETQPSIHLVRGKVAHSVLEDFFKIDLDKVSSDNYDFEFKIILHELLSRHWEKSADELSKLPMSGAEIESYFEETKEMVQFWLLDFIGKLDAEIKGDKKGDAERDNIDNIDNRYDGDGGGKGGGKGLSFKEAFQNLSPRTEEHFISEELGVQGYIDAIHEDPCTGVVKIIDYKTSKRDNIIDEYRLQLGIYSVLYLEKYNRMPTYAGLFFLKHGERLIEVDDELLRHAVDEIEKVHLSAVSDNIEDYPKKPSPLCKFRTGQCDFYCQCQKE
ncbi:PD-(D/E)XK nuclease family protein [Candidatus Woesearchaeota archaeon]|nr:PD-(D/E)XK nuclease family protein [Candidatus Woesearchaeota archaeon]